MKNVLVYDDHARTIERLADMNDLSEAEVVSMLFDMVDLKNLCNYYNLGYVEEED